MSLFSKKTKKFGVRSSEHIHQAEVKVIVNGDEAQAEFSGCGDGIGRAIFTMLQSAYSQDEMREDMLTGLAVFLAKNEDVSDQLEEVVEDLFGDKE
jgi:hypothetical protein